jgi:hypothetical protein
MPPLPPFPLPPPQRPTSRLVRGRGLVAGVVVLGLLAVTLLASPGAAGEPGRLANLAHLDFLGDRVDPPGRAGHTTW